MVPPKSCIRHLAPKVPQLHRRLPHAATPGKAIHRETQGEHAYLSNSPFVQDLFVAQHSSLTPALSAGRFDEQAGPDISRLAPHQEWDHEANARLDSIIIGP